MGQKNMICHKIFLPYDITPVLLKKSPIYYTYLLWKKLQNLLFIGFYGRSSFFCPIRHSNSMGPKNGFWKNFWSIFLRICLTPSSCDYCLLIFFSVIHKTLASYRKTSCFFTIKWIMWRICGHLICNGWLNTLSWLQI